MMRTVALAVAVTVTTTTAAAAAAVSSSGAATSTGLQEQLDKLIFMCASLNVQNQKSNFPFWCSAHGAHKCDAIAC